MLNIFARLYLLERSHKERLYIYTSVKCELNHTTITVKKLFIKIRLRNRMQQEHFQTLIEMKNKNMVAQTENPDSHLNRRVCGFRRSF